MSEDQILQVPLGGGLDESVDDAFVPATRMRVCQNVVFPDTNTSTKRPGLTTLAPLTNAQRLVTRKNELLCSDGVNLQAWVPSQGAWVSRGRISPCLATRSLLASGNLQAQGFGSLNYPIAPLGSIAEDSGTGLRVRVWCDGLSVQASVSNPTTGAIVQTWTLSAAAGDSSGSPTNNPRVFVHAGVAFAIWWDSSIGTPSLCYSALTVANVPAGWSAATTIPLINAVTSVDAWDACYTNDPSAIISIATGTQSNGQVYVTNFVTAGTNLVAGELAIAIETVPNIGGGTAQPAIQSIGLAGSTASGICVAYAYYTYNGTGTNTYVLRSATVSPSGATIVAAFTRHTDFDNFTSTPYSPGATYTAISVADLGSGIFAISASRMARLVSTATGGATGSTGREITCAWMFITPTTGTNTFGPLMGYQTISKPFTLTVGGVQRIYQLLEFVDNFRLSGFPLSGTGSHTWTPTIQTGTNTLVLVEWSAANGPRWTSPYPCATFASGFAGDAAACRQDVAIHTTGLGASVVGLEQDVALKTSLTELSLDFQSPNLWQSAELGDWSLIAGGMPTIYDGNITSEIGFLNPPPAPVFLAVTGTPAKRTSSQLQYVAIYAWQDDNGNVHRSPPSAILTVNASAGFTQVNVGLVPCQLTLRQAVGATSGVLPANPVRIELYSNNEVTPTIFQLVASIPNDTTTLASGLITYVDVSLDSVVPTSPFLYTTGGAVPGAAAPNLAAIAVHADRFVGIDEDGRTMWFTTEYVPGECPRFSDTFTLPWPRGPITATWSLEQRLHAATADRTFYVLGEGPTDTDVGVDWTAPEDWQTDFGVIDARGLAVFEEGVVLNTARGVYVEGRDGSFVWVGERVKIQLAANPVVTSISPLTADGVVRIACATSDPGATSVPTGEVLHWDRRKDRWSVHLRGGSPGVVPVSTAVVQSVYYALYRESIPFVGTVNFVVQESASTSLDDGTWVTGYQVSGWADVGGMQGSARAHRVMMLASSQTPHGITIATARDYQPSFDSDTGVWSDADIAAMGFEQMRHTPTNQKCMAISVAITDSAPTSLPLGAVGSGPIYRSLMLRIQGRRGETKRLTAAQKR